MPDEMKDALPADKATETGVESTPTEEAKAEVTNTPAEPVLKFVGDDKKFGSVTDLDKAYDHADGHIKKLEAENAELRKKMESEAKLDKIIEALEKQTKTVETTAPSVEQTATEKPQAIDVDAVASSVKERLQAEANVKAVNDELSTKFGDKAPEVVAARLQDLGMSAEEVAILAQRSPAAAIKLLDDGAKPTAPATTTAQGDVNTEGTGLSGGTYPEGSFMYYEQQHKAGNIDLATKERLQTDSALSGKLSDEDYWKGMKK